MDMGMDFKPNSHKSKEEQNEVSTEVKKVEKVVSGPVRTKKKGDIRKLTDVFISEDVHNVKNYILMDVLVPAIKDAIEDIITNGIRMILRGETSARKSSSGATKVSYRNFYERRDEGRRPSESARATGYSYDDFIFDNRGEGEEVLSRMEELIEVYGLVSVADLYDLVGETGNGYTDNKYGWTNLRSAEVIRVRNGYMLKLPRAMPIN